MSKQADIVPDCKYDPKTLVVSSNLSAALLTAPKVRAPQSCRYPDMAEGKI